MTSTEPATIAIELYPEDSERGAIKIIELGAEPVVLIEAEEVDDELIFKFTGSLINDVEELLTLLQGMVSLLEMAVAQNEEEK